MKISDLYKVASSKRVLKSDWKSEGVPFYRGREITTLSKFGYVENDLYITEEMYNDFTLNYGVPVANDIMVTAIGTIGNTYIVKSEDKFYFKDASVLWLKKEKEIDSNFTNYWFKSIHFTNQLDVGLGATVDTLTIGKVQSLKINVPSPSTQKKIVSKLDAIFSEIDKATAAAEANAKNAEALFQSYLEKIFDSKNENWITATLKDVCEKITDGTHQTPTYFDDGVIFLSSKNVTSGKIDWDRVKYIDGKQHLEMSKRVSPKFGDVLLAKNGTTGVAAMVDRNVVFDIYVSLALLRAKEQVLPQFLLYFVNSPVAKKQFNSRLNGLGVPNLHLQEIREVVISFPKSLDEQRILVKQIESFLDITTLQGIRYKNKKIEIAKLKESILKQAFNGELFKE